MTNIILLFLLIFSPVLSCGAIGKTLDRTAASVSDGEEDGDSDSEDLDHSFGDAQGEKLSDVVSSDTKNKSKDGKTSDGSSIGKKKEKSSKAPDPLGVSSKPSDTSGASSSAGGKSSSAADPEAFIQDLGDKAIKNLTGKNLSREERNKKFESMFVVAFDYEKIGKFVLGRYRREAKQSELEEYLKLFKDTIVGTYASRFGEYHEEKFKVVSHKNVDDKTLVVSSQIVRPNDSKISIDWQLYQNDNGELKIFDVVVEGVSMALTQRSEFSSILEKEGGMHGLNKVLRERSQGKATAA